MKDLIYRDPVGRPGRFAPWLNELRKQSGAYVIRSRRTHEILYVGESHSGNLAKTIKRHFFTWNDETDRTHFTASRHQVEIAVRITPPTTAKAAQNNLISRLQPDKNVAGLEEKAPF